MEKKIIYSWDELDYWIECKEAFVLKRLLKKIEKDIFPIMILPSQNKNIFKEEHINYYLIESEEESFDKWKEIGFIHICNSKDDLPIMMFEIKNII